MSELVERTRMANLIRGLNALQSALAYSLSYLFLTQSQSSG